MHRRPKIFMYCYSGVFIQSFLLLTYIAPGLASDNFWQASGSITKTSKLSNTLAQIPAPLEKPQSQPNRERFVQPLPPGLDNQLPKTEPKLTNTEEPAQSDRAIDTDSEPPSEEAELIPVKKIAVAGNTVFDNKRIRAIVAPLEGKSVTQAALEKATRAIADLYLQAGYITSFAQLDEESLGTDTVKIEVVEAGIQEVRVEGTHHLKPNYVRDRIQRGITYPVNANKLEQQLRLLRIDPGFTNVEASLQPGRGKGQNILVVRVKEARQFGTSFSFDNYSPPSIAPERATIGAQYRDLLGLGDELTVAYGFGTNLEKEFSRAGLNVYDFTYRIPLNSLDGTLQFRAVPYTSKVTEDDFRDLGIRGSTEIYELSFRQPLTKSLTKEFALSLGLTFQDGQTFVDDDDPTNFGIGPDADGFSRTRVLQFGQDYISRDPKGAWALRSQLNLGLGLFGATDNDGSVPDGSFFSFSGQVQRSQLLGNDYALIMQGNLQLSPDPLLSSQQFFIGGGQSLRGYRQNVRAADNGFLLSVEGRIPVARNKNRTPVVQLAPFIDMGAVWNNGSNPNPIPDQNFLASTGLGILWQPTPSLGLRLDWGIPFVNLDDRRDSLQDNGIHFSINYSP